MACDLASPDTLPGLATAVHGPAVDHIGVVVRDLDAEVATWRASGFLVSDPVPLMGAGPDGRSVPLGQASAHVVFENGYVELSSPVPGSGNHLEPYLAHGEGVRILVLATGQAEEARAALAVDWPGISPVREASRLVAIGTVRGSATFRWFPLPWDVVPGVLCAMVQHRSRDLVLHPSLAEHPNGLRRMVAIVSEGRADDLRDTNLPRPRADAPPLVVLACDRTLAITGVLLTGEREKRLLRLV